MPRWVRVASTADCPPGGAIEVVADDHVLALFHIGDEFLVLDGVCPHQGGPLGRGKLSGCIVTCPWHGWRFDVRTGQHQISATLRQPRYATRVDEGSIYVELP